MIVKFQLLLNGRISNLSKIGYINFIGPTLIGSWDARFHRVSRDDSYTKHVIIVTIPIYCFETFKCQHVPYITFFVIDVCFTSV